MFRAYNYNDMLGMQSRQYENDKKLLSKTHRKSIEIFQMYICLLVVFLVLVENDIFDSL